MVEVVYKKVMGPTDSTMKNPPRVFIRDNTGAKAHRMDLLVKLAPMEFIDNPHAQGMPGGKKTTNRQVREFSERTLEMTAMVDSGAEVSCVSEECARRLYPKGDFLPLVQDAWATGLGGSMRALGKINVIVRLTDNRAVCHEFRVFRETPLPILIGLNLMPALGLSVVGMPTPPFPKEDASDAPDDREPLLPSEDASVCPIPPGVQVLLDENATIPATSVCSHELATVRIDMHPGLEPLYVPTQLNRYICRVRI
ncbi:hypothetical protein BC828DRAFT_227974 [Blastocladiella britannica]|nr:hypothetical protein BC828DRAFT_227974 [Blastocladiella britannica]